MFQPIHSHKSAEAVSSQIEALILDGILQSGDRLPGERELAAETGVSRPIVREAIKSLESRKLLEIRHGGGTYVANVIGTLFTPQIAEILPKHSRATQDYLEFRKTIEGAATVMAAERATPSDRALLTTIMEAMEAAFREKDYAKENLLDAEFHAAIGEMSHNLVIIHTLRSCNQLLELGIFQNRERLLSFAGGHDLLLTQHRDIYNAILSRDASAARIACDKHLDFIIQQTRLMEGEDDRERIASLRNKARQNKASSV